MHSPICLRHMSQKDYKSIKELKENENKEMKTKDEQTGNKLQSENKHD